MYTEWRRVNKTREKKEVLCELCKGSERKFQMHRKKRKKNVRKYPFTAILFDIDGTDFLTQ